MGNRTVITLEKIIDHGFPVSLDAISQAMGESEFRQIGRVLHDFAGEIPGLLCKGCCVRVKVDEDQVAECLDLNFIQTNLLLIKIFQVFRTWRGDQGAVEIVGPGMVGAGDSFYLAFAEQ